MNATHPNARPAQPYYNAMDLSECSLHDLLLYGWAHSACIALAQETFDTEAGKAIIASMQTQVEWIELALHEHGIFPMIAIVDSGDVCELLPPEAHEDDTQKRVKFWADAMDTGMGDFTLERTYAIEVNDRIVAVDSGIGRAELNLSFE